MLDYNRDILPYLNCDAEAMPMNKELIGSFYDKAHKHHEDLEELFESEYPKFLAKNRPRETEDHKKYRKEIFKNVTVPFLNDAKKMVTATLNASDYDVRWPNTQVNITPNQKSLKDYIESGIPKIGDVSEWFWNLYPKAIVLDPNAAICVLPLVQNAADSEMVKPEPILIESENVIMLKRGTFGVIRLEEKHKIKVGNKYENIGRTLIFFDSDTYTICKQLEKTAIIEPIKNEKITQYTWEILGISQIFDQENQEFGLEFKPPSHNNDFMPLWRIGNIIEESNGFGEEYYESFISPAIPFLQKCLQRDSDLEIEVLHKVHAYEWFFAFKACNYTGCENGYIKDFDQQERPIRKVCPNCGGTGMPKGGLDRIIITPEKMKSFGDDTKGGNMAVPPGGFIPRDIQGLIEFRNEFIRNWEMAYSSINSQFKTKMPLSTSGTSKQYDRQEYYRDLANLAKNSIQNGFLKIIKSIDSYIYATNEALKKVQIPEITIPKDSFNLDTLPELIDEYKQLKESGADAITIYGIESKICIKKFGSDSVEKKRLDLKYICDPYYSVDEKKKREQLLYELYAWKNILLDNDVNTLKIAKDIFFSLQYEAIFQEVIAENEKFDSKTFDQQVKLIKAAKEKIEIGQLREFTDLKGIVINPPVDAKNINQI